MKVESPADGFDLRSAGGPSDAPTETLPKANSVVDLMGDGYAPRIPEPIAGSRHGSSRWQRLPRLYGSGDLQPTPEAPPNETKEQAHQRLGVECGLVRVVVERPKAFRLYFAEYRETRWIPKAVIHRDSEIWKSKTGLLFLEPHFARREKLGFYRAPAAQQSLFK